MSSYPTSYEKLIKTPHLLIPCPVSTELRTDVHCCLLFRAARSEFRDLGALPLTVTSHCTDAGVGCSVSEALGSTDRSAATSVRSGALAAVAALGALLAVL